jgi:hypothetical protein
LPLDFTLISCSDYYSKLLLTFTVRVRVTLRLAVYRQPVRLGNKPL